MSWSLSGSLVIFSRPNHSAVMANQKYSMVLPRGFDTRIDAAHRITDKNGLSRNIVLNPMNSSVLFSRWRVVRCMLDKKAIYIYNRVINSGVTFCGAGNVGLCVGRYAISMETDVRCRPGLLAEIWTSGRLCAETLFLQMR